MHSNWYDISIEEEAQKEWKKKIKNKRIQHSSSHQNIIILLI